MNNYTRNIYYLCAVLTLIGAAIWLWYSPICVDDIPYRHQLLSDIETEFWSCQNPLIKTFGQAWDSLYYHYLCVNSRLSNLVYIMMQPLAREVQALICAAFIGVFYLLLGWTTRCSAVAVFLMPVVFITSFSWYDHFASFDFQANYIWPGVLMLLMIYGWRHFATGKGWLTAGGAVLGFVTGWFHEATAAPLLVWIALYSVFYRRPTRQQILIFGALVAGTLINLLGESMNHIAYTQSYFSITALPYMLTHILNQLWTLIAATLLICFRPVRRRIHNRRVYFYIISAWVESCIAIYTGTIGRGLWPAETLGAVAFLEIVAVLFANSRRWCTAATVMAVLYGAYWAQVGVWQVKLDREYSAMMENLGDTPLIHADLHTRRDIPWHIQMFVSHLILERYWAIVMFARENFNADGMAVVPTDLQPFPGDAGLQGKPGLGLITRTRQQGYWFHFGPGLLCNDTIKIWNKVRVYPVTPLAEGDTLFNVVPGRFGRSTDTRRIIKITKE